MAEDIKNAARLRASLVFLDESGLLMAPHLRRTWAPVGESPVFYRRTRSHEKVSAIGAISVSPRRRRVGLYFALLPNENVTAENLIPFLRELQKHLRRPIILLWDRLNVHRAILVRRFLDRTRRIRTEPFPAYAPELNPVEGVWEHLKRNPLAHYAPESAADLWFHATCSAHEIRTNQPLL
ncbi:MAG: transposase [Candidatus Eisenbacteria bacterium]|nr:transposase [Candidatus Eisenbacteria bacterium]